MKKSILFLALAAIITTSCVESSNKYKQLKAERDSLMMANAKTNADFDEMLATLNEVEAGFAEMKVAENYLIDQSKINGEPTVPARQRIMEQMDLLNKTLTENREKLALLEKQMKQSKNENSVLRSTLKRLNEELENRTLLIANLQEELSKRNIRIDELNTSVNNLHQEVSNLNEISEEQQEKINTQDKEMNTAWYCFGTSAELKKEQIITGGGLFRSKEVMQKEFNKSYFTAIDIRQLKEIPLMSKRAKILTNQPKESYTLVKGEGGLLTLEITDVQRFWSLTKYLVIQVD